MKLTNLDILNEDYWFLLYKTGWALIIIFSELPLMPHFLPAVFLQLHTCCQRKILFFVRSPFLPHLKKYLQKNQFLQRALCLVYQQSLLFYGNLLTVKIAF